MDKPSKSEDDVTLKQEIETLEAKISKAKRLIEKGNYSPAKDILTEYLSYTINSLKEDQNSNYYSFRNILELLISYHKIKSDKAIHWTTYKISEAYQMLSIISRQNKDDELALKYLNSAIIYNPINPNYYLDIADIYKDNQDYNNMLLIANKSYEYIFDNQELARYYRTLGAYYLDKVELDLSYSLYAYSLKYEISSESYSQITRIRRLKKSPSYILSNEKILSLLQEANIPLDISEENKNIILSITTKEESNNKKSIRK